MKIVVLRRLRRICEHDVLRDAVGRTRHSLIFTPVKLFDGQGNHITI